MFALVLAFLAVLAFARADRMDGRRGMRGGYPAGDKPASQLKPPPASMTSRRGVTSRSRPRSGGYSARDTGQPKPPPPAGPGAGTPSDPGVRSRANGW